MKKIFFLVFLLSSALLANAQSKIDSAIKKADTAINAKTKQLNKTKDEINTIQNNISTLIDLKSKNDKNIDSLNKIIKILDSKKKRTQKQNNDLIIENNKLNKAQNKQKYFLDSLNKKVEFANNKLEFLKLTTDTLTNQLAQKKTTISKANLALIQKTDSISTANKTLSKTQSLIAKQLDLLKTVAIIEALDSTSIHLSDNKIVRYKINSVHINVAQGIILEIMVKTDKGTFRNKGRAKTGGIVIADLLHFEDFTERKLYIEKFSSNDPLEKNEGNAFVYLKDVIRYKPVSSYTDAVYGEFEITLPLAEGERLYLIKESTSINSYFNIAAFTDIKGISGEPNGIAQFTADAKFMLNTKAISGTSIVAFNNISFQGGLSKFDTEFKGTKLSNTDSVSRKDLLQRANYKLGIKLNLFKGYLPSKPDILYNNFELNIGYNVIGTQIFKTGFKDLAKTVIDTTFKTVTQNQWYIEPAITFSRSKNFSMCLTMPYFLNNVKKSASIQNNHTEHWAVPGISLMYFGKRDDGSKIFFRYNHYINIKDKTQAFSQMQLGYSLNLTQVLKE